MNADTIQYKNPIKKTLSKRKPISEKCKNKRLQFYDRRKTPDHTAP